MSENTQILLIIWAFWLFVGVLDLTALLDLRRSRVGATAILLWVVWIVVAPVVGSISYYIVRPAWRAG